MKLTVLTENAAGTRFLAEHGLSYLIEHDGMIILFDAGHSDVFLKNSRELGIDLINKIDCIVLSHGHWDHGNGLTFLSGKPLITHPEAFKKRFRKNENINKGLSLSQEELSLKFQLTTSEKPYYITPQILYLGSIPRLNDYEAQSTAFVDEQGEEDYIPDDSALVLIKGNELIIMSGCAHAGICNICEYAKKVTGISAIRAVVGGFHLGQANEQLRRTIRYFQSQEVHQLIPSHCTELPALAAFHQVFGIRQLKAGQILRFE